MKQNNGLTNVNTNLIDLNIFVIYKKLKYVFVKQVFFFFWVEKLVKQVHCDMYFCH